LVLTAQSVPSAGLLPCLRPLPTGWTFRQLDAEKGEARILIDFEHEGSNAATVTLTHTCDIRGTSQTVSDQLGTRRYEREDAAQSSYRGERYYRFDGGCITYRFSLQGARAAEQVAAVSLSLGFVDREVVRRYVDDYSDGRLELDPTAGGGD
jgi:hypothetical protein